MMDELKHRSYGTPLSEWMSTVAGDLDRDATGLWQLVPAGRDGFGLTGESLIEFVRRAIYVLIEAGALPVRAGKGTDFEWIAQPQYGTTKEQIADAVISEWQQTLVDPHILYRVWFARPDPAFPRYVKMD